MGNKKKQVTAEFADLAVVLSERNSRLLIVISIIGSSFGIYTVLWGMLKSSFSTIELGGFPLNFQQLFFSILVTSITMIMFVLGYYLYKEAFSYINDKIEKKKYIQNAEKIYKKALRTTRTIIVISIVLIVSLIFLFTIPVIIFVIFGSILILLTVLFWIAVSKLKMKGIFLRNVFEKIKNFQWGVLAIWLFLFSLIAILGISLFLFRDKPQVEIKFDSKNPSQFTINFTETIPDDVDVYVVNTTTKKIALKGSDFDKAFYETIQSNNSDYKNVSVLDSISKKQFVGSGSSYFYRKSVSIDNYLVSGQNYISLQFSRRDLFGILKREYKIVDEIDKNAQNVIPFKADMQLDL